jgi:cell division septal protein FtsQ
VKISGLGRLPENAISEKIWSQAGKSTFWPFTRSNIFLFDKKTSITELTNTFNFSKVEINKNLFHTINVRIEERPYAFIWQEAGKSYYSDSKGYIIRDSEVTAEDLQRFPIIENQSGRELATSEYIQMDLDYLSFIFTLKGEVEKNPGLLIDRFIIDQEFKTVKVKFKDGLLAYFNTQEEATKQLDKLLVVKKEKIKDNLDKINYLDLRYGDKVYIGNK